MNQKSWFTPEGIEDLLPQQAKPLEFYRRQLLDSFDASGYDLVLPPVAEFTDSLLTGTGSQMATETCRFTDQESGKMMGVRADMTPQVARIVSNRFKDRKGIIRLCYVGEVLKTLNNKAKGSRSPIQIGAELFGDSGVESDIEVIHLMLDSMQSLGLKNLNLSLGHVGIVETLMNNAKLSTSQREALVDILQRKAIPEFTDFIASLGIDGVSTKQFLGLMTLVGDAPDVLEKAQFVLNQKDFGFEPHLNRLNQIVTSVSMHYPQVKVHLDLSDLRGYRYHTGIIFACYSVGQKLYPIAKGGRYDGIGETFGLSHPATGFSMDLRSALDMLDKEPVPVKTKVFIPTSNDLSLVDAVKKLKAEGYRVIRQLPNSDLPEGSLKLEKQNSAWVLVNA
ncbi:ATP phosphoribosyltransferase regulatory subunit [Thiosulfativibrio zosterae]|uniref:ATP phosphoribosyltransferase regulatory subunit n=1 Tax=Thiosulfativibrio zosterae TaxID=2675053 RepID=A0A6F8PP08_9GAMM|nr:ATP phosphoribosyltransferase regulatory subunit [Thiosulfativibrio zosterae]BBP43835.1 ATP phosphoribosyltransferase regulatory subunit [Thiosulfativibrio zosterae]